MVDIRRHCDNHPDRPAIGVCVETGQAICAECSTRYEGVNYSREGLEALKQRRQVEQRGRSTSGRWLVWAAVACVPWCGAGLYFFYNAALRLMLQAMQAEGG